MSPAFVCPLICPNGSLNSVTLLFCGVCLAVARFIAPPCPRIGENRALTIVSGPRATMAAVWHSKCFSSRGVPRGCPSHVSSPPDSQGCTNSSNAGGNVDICTARECYPGHSARYEGSQSINIVGKSPATVLS